MVFTLFSVLKSNAIIIFKLILFIHYFAYCVTFKMHYSKNYILLLNYMKQQCTVAAQKGNLKEEERMKLGKYGKFWKSMSVVQDSCSFIWTAP